MKASASLVALAFFWVVFGSATAQVPIPLVPLSQVFVGGSLNRPTLARIKPSGPEPVTAAPIMTTTGELFIGYERRMNAIFSVALSGHFMSVPMAIGFDEYELTDTVGGIRGPVGRGTMRLGEWIQFGTQLELNCVLQKYRRVAFGVHVGLKSVLSPRARFIYGAGYDGLYSTTLNALQVVGHFDQRVAHGVVFGLRMTTRSKNDNGIQLSLLGALFPDDNFTGTMYTLRGTSLERQAKYSQNPSFVGLSIAIYKSWGPPKVPMRLRKDREP